MNIQRIVLCAFYTPTPSGFGLPLLFTGPVGDTKTAMHYAWAEEFGVPFVHASPGQKGEVWFGNTPYPMTNGDGETFFTFPSNLEMNKLYEAGCGLILVDELRSQPRTTKVPCLALAQERLFGPGQMPPGVRVFAASNSAREAVNGSRLALPERSRFCHINWQGPTSAQMRSYHMKQAASSDLFPTRQDKEETQTFRDNARRREEIEGWIRADRRQQLSRAAAEVFSFTESVATDGKDRLRQSPEKPSEGEDTGFATPRTWSMVCSALATWRTLLDRGVLQPHMIQLGAQKKVPVPEHEDIDLLAIVCGLVGEATGTEFMVWLGAQDLPDYGDWLDGKVEVEFEAGVRDDRTYVILQGAAAHLLGLSGDKVLQEKRVRSFYAKCLPIAQTSGWESVMAAFKIALDANLWTSSKECNALMVANEKAINGQ